MARLAIALLLALAPFGLLAATPPATPQQPQPPTFRALTDIVRFDVTVLGPDGKPVHGLKREDFTVLEDGKPRDILGFGEINIPDASANPPWMRDAKPDVRSALDGRVLVFILDDAQTRLLDTPGWIKTVTRVTDEIIDRMGPQDVAAVICTYDNRCDQDFTTDHVRLKGRDRAVQTEGSVHRAPRVGRRHPEPREIPANRARTPTVDHLRHAEDACSTGVLGAVGHRSHRRLPWHRLERPGRSADSGVGGPRLWNLGRRRQHHRPRGSCIRSKRRCAPASRCTA
jgi:hypothetical protein